MKFDNGPANATKYKLFLPRLRRLILTGTGLAHPNLIIRIASVPNGSKCFNGFKVNLPNRLAVSSPSLYEARAWLYSWTVSENNTIGIIIKYIGSITIFYTFT